MELAVGTAGLTSKFSEEYWKIFCNAIENKYYIHTALNYANVDQYFSRANSENLKIHKSIIKIEINQNPIKKIINIPKQINLILEKFKLEFIDTVQICNNPSANKLNLLMLKLILEKYKKKHIIKNFFLESFEPFSNNLNKLINDNFFEGYIFKFNCLQRGTSKEFLNKIINSQKKIISISPLAGGNFLNILNNFDISFKEQIDEILHENNLEDYNSLNIAFLKSTKSMKAGIFGTKKSDRILKIKKLIESTKFLKEESVKKIINLQEKYKSVINY